MPDPAPCIHSDGTGLCPDCQAAFDEDPTAYDEFGDHLAGLERWRELQEEMARERDELARDAARPRAGAVPADEEIPY